MILGILGIIGLVLLAMLCTAMTLVVIYIILTLTYKLVDSLHSTSIKPSNTQRYCATPKCKTTGKTEKLKDFIEGFLFFWSPFKRDKYGVQEVEDAKTDTD